MKERMKEIATNNRPKKQNNNIARAQGALWSIGAQGPSDGLIHSWHFSNLARHYAPLCGVSDSKIRSHSAVCFMSFFDDSIMSKTCPPSSRI